MVLSSVLINSEFCFNEFCALSKFRYELCLNLFLKIRPGPSSSLDTSSIPGPSPSPSKVKVKGHGHQGQRCKNSSFRPSFRKAGPRSRQWGSRSQRSRSKVIGQGSRVKVKAIGRVLYPIDLREVRHAVVFILIGKSE